jgi:hypothetical protein
MKKYFFFIFTVLGGFLKSFSQPIDLPDPKVYKDTSTYYYITFYEQFYEIFLDNNSFYKESQDTCLINFNHYDLKGLKQNNIWKWELISPKKNKRLFYKYLPAMDTISWKMHLNNCVIQDSIQYSELKEKSRYGNLPNVDFANEILIYNEVWVDCHGEFSFWIEYNDLEHKIYFHLLKYYGRCCGMRMEDNWIVVKKPSENFEMVFDEIWVN